jgi:hypothetical protein
MAIEPVLPKEGGIEAQMWDLYSLLGGAPIHRRRKRRMRP